MGDAVPFLVTPELINRDGRYIDPQYPAWFAHDIIDCAADKAHIDTVILLTSADAGFMPGTREVLERAFAKWGCVHLRRRNFQRIDAPITNPEIVLTGGDYPGMDTCAFTAGWWRFARKLLPDVLYGRQHWDSAMRNLIRLSQGIELRDLEWHEEHWPTVWGSGKTNAANLYNERLVCEWIGRHGGSTQDHNYSTSELGYH